MPRLSLFAALPLLWSSARADEPKKDVTRVACLGDSITYGAGVEKREQNNYPKVLGKLLGDKYEVGNFGVSGATLLRKGDKPYHKEPAYAAAQKFDPQIVVIKLGTNDTKPQNWKHEADFVADAKTMVAEISNWKSKPKVYLCVPVPVYPPGAFGIAPDGVEKGVKPKVEGLGKELEAAGHRPVRRPERQEGDVPRHGPPERGRGQGHRRGGPQGADGQGMTPASAGRYAPNATVSSGAG